MRQHLSLSSSSLGLCPSDQFEALEEKKRQSESKVPGILSKQSKFVCVYLFNFYLWFECF